MLKVYSLFSAVPNTSSDPTGQWKLNHCANEVTFVVTVELSYALWQLLHIALTDYTEGKENHLRPTRNPSGFVAVFVLFSWLPELFKQDSSRWSCLLISYLIRYLSGKHWPINLSPRRGGPLCHVRYILYFNIGNIKRIQFNFPVVFDHQVTKT